MRDYRIDILRFIGLSMIILAHVGPPVILFQLRNFDVPLMVLVSGMSFSLTYTTQDSYKIYIWKRIKRLVFPCWIFLSLYFSIEYIFCPSSSQLNYETIFTSYTLLSGIGYVWVIRVFLLVAVVAPFLFKLNSAIKDQKTYYLLFAVCYIFYEFCRYIILPYNHGMLGVIFCTMLLYMVSYAFIFSLGIKILQINKTHVARFGAINGSVFLFIGILLYIYYGKLIPTQNFKYPPSLYYFSYAIFISFYLWRYGEQIKFFLKRIKLLSIALFVANHSIWIYLWHICFINIIHKNFIVRYFLVYIAAICVTCFQVKIVKCFILPYVKNIKCQKNIRIILLG